MTRILHILTQSPDEWVQGVLQTQQVTPGIEVRIQDLTQPQVDYDRLLEEIFQAEAISVW